LRLGTTTETVGRLVLLNGRPLGSFEERRPTAPETYLEALARERKSVLQSLRSERRTCCERVRYRLLWKLERRA